MRIAQDVPNLPAVTLTPVVQQVVPKLIFQTIGLTARIQVLWIQFMDVQTVVPAITIRKRPVMTVRVLTEPVDVRVLDKLIPMEMEAQTAVVAGVTRLLELVLTARAVVTFLTKNTVT